MKANFERVRILAKQIIDPSMVGSGILIGNVIGGLLWLILASLMSTEDYGLVNYYIAIASVASAVSILGLNTAIMTHLAKGNELMFKQASLLVLMLSSGASIVVAVLTNNIPAAILLLGLSAFAMTVAEVLARKRYKRYSLLMIACRSSQFVLAIVLYQIIGINGVIIGYTIPSLIFGYRFFAIRKPSLSFNEIRGRSGFVTHTYSLSLSQVTVAYADKLLIAPLFGFAILGVYQLAFQFLLFLTVIPSSLLQYLIPQEASGKSRKAVRKFGLIFAFVTALLSFAIIPYVISVLFPRYVEAIPAAQIMIFGIIPLTINALLHSRLLGTENSRPVLYGSIVYASSLTAMFILLGGTLGIVGLAISTVMSLSFQSLTLWISSLGLRSRSYAET